MWVFSFMLRPPNCRVNELIASAEQEAGAFSQKDYSCSNDADSCFYQTHGSQSPVIGPNLILMIILYLYITFKLIPSIILNLGLISGSFALGFPTKILHSFIISLGSRSILTLTGTPNIVRGSVIFFSYSDNGRFIPQLSSSLLSII